jgi:hypothetical protein
MGQVKNKERRNMSTQAHPANSPRTPSKPKTAEEALSDKMKDLVDRAAMRMNDKEFKRAHENGREIIARVRASRRETR